MAPRVRTSAVVTVTHKFVSQSLDDVLMDVNLDFQEKDALMVYWFIVILLNMNKWWMKIKRQTTRSFKYN